jgi:predicted nuclease of restriction endonuclease-like (RecB) superfamily
MKKITDGKPEAMAARPAELLPEADEAALFEGLGALIERHKRQAADGLNLETTLMFREIGERVNKLALENQGADSSGKILPTLSAKLTARFGDIFSERNLAKMGLFSERFAEAKILPTLSAKLSWSHFLELLSIEDDEARIWQAIQAATLGYGVKELRRQISRKAFERREMAGGARLGDGSVAPFNAFKDPFALSLLGLKDNCLGADLKTVMLEDIKALLLDSDQGFAFVGGRKRLMADGEEMELDLLFYQRGLERLVAVELELGRFKAAYREQMMTRLKWLDKSERLEGEKAPIGVVICATANRGRVELLEMDKTGIAAAELWTRLPPKAEFEARIKAMRLEAQERLERRKSFPVSGVKKEVDYFFDEKDDEDE